MEQLILEKVGVYIAAQIKGQISSFEVIIYTAIQKCGVRMNTFIGCIKLIKSDSEDF